LVAEAAEHTDSMHHNHQVVQQAVAVEEVLIQQAVVAEVLVEQVEEHGDKIKNILGECTQVILHIHQQQMKVLLKADQEWQESHQAASQQLADKVDQDFMDWVEAAADLEDTQWVEVQTAEALVEQEMEALMETLDNQELMAQAEAAAEQTAELVLELVAVELVL
jgi:hypothetical protein